MLLEGSPRGGDTERQNIINTPLSSYVLGLRYSLKIKKKVPVFCFSFACKESMCPITRSTVSLFSQSSLISTQTFHPRDSGIKETNSSL